MKAAGTKEGCKPDGRDHGAPCAGKAPFDMPTLKPYWGKPAVRNFRGDDGNVGIIRSPVRAIALPDIAISAERARRLCQKPHAFVVPERVTAQAGKAC